MSKTIILKRKNPRTKAVETREYELPEGLTFAEADYVKRMTATPTHQGYRGAEINEGLMAGDAMLIAALTIIAVRRSGEQITEEEILDMEADSIDFRDDEDEEPEEDPQTAASEAATGAVEPEAAA